MANITVTLNDVQLPLLHTPFARQLSENAADTQTLDGTLYTDFVGQRRTWSLHWEIMSEDEFNALKALYDAQFTTESYPLADIPYFGVEALPVRMTLNNPTIEDDGCTYVGVDVTLTEKYVV